MARREIKVTETTAKVIDRIADHYQAAEGHRPSRAATVARISTYMWRLLNRGELTQEYLADGGAANGRDDTQG